MSFKQCLVLDSKYLWIQGKILKVSRQLASKLPDTRIYSVETILGLCKSCSNGDHEEVAQALQDIGVVKLTETTLCSVCDVPVKMCGCEGPTKVDSRFEVVGTLMTLIDNLKKAAHYFISFCSEEAKLQATELHNELMANGIEGFASCSELGTGDHWKTEILSNLKRSSVFFALESPMYHRRSRCQIERDLAVTGGLSFVRVGLCLNVDLNGAPPYMADIQYDRFVDDRGAFLLSQKLLGQRLPRRQPLDIRRNAARLLLEPFTPDVIDDWALQLNVRDEIQRGLSPTAMKTAFLDVVFRSENRADAFWQILDPAKIF